jgi:biopolymer transport protein TolR
VPTEIMRTSARKRTRALLADINITPLLDVLLAILCTLLLLPHAAKRLPVELPNTTLTGTPVLQSSLQVSVLPSGALWWGDHTISTTEMGAKITPGVTTVEIAAASAAPYGEVARVVAALRAARPKEIVLLTN